MSIAVTLTLLFSVSNAVLAVALPEKFAAGGMVFNACQYRRYPASLGRYWSASARWAASIRALAARSAMVRASLSTRW